MARFLTFAPRAAMIGLAMLLACCHAPLTQLVVVVESDLPPGTIAVVRIEVGDGAAPRTSEVRLPDDATLPFSFGVRARGEQDERVEVRLFARDATDAVIAQARARIPFVRGELRRAIVRLERACAGREPACAADDRTCRAGDCVDPSIPVGELTPIAAGDELLELPPFPAADGGPHVLPDAGPVCEPACPADEICSGGRCRCGPGVGCGAGSLCEEGACIPWPTSCDEAGRARGCDVIELPAGVLTMGDEDADSGVGDRAFPEQPSISVGAFGLDAYEVTLARFRRFWEAGHEAPAGPVSYPRGRTVEPGLVVEPELETVMAGCNWSAEPGEREDHPINCVSFDTALAFCVWDGGRLPTEAEWEWAARGHALGGLTPGRDYAWGNEEPDGPVEGGCDRAQLFGCAGEDGASTLPVGSFAGVIGLYDQIGNVAEWTADHYDEYGVGEGGCWREMPQLDPLCKISPPPARHTTRGSNWSAISPRLAYSAARMSTMGVNVDVGFRCARAPR